MKVTVKVKLNPLPIDTEYIKLQDAMKLSNCVESGGEAKVRIQEGQVKVNGEVCDMRGKKLRPGDTFSYRGASYEITARS